VKAVVLDHTKLGEQDLILTLLGSDGCQLRAVAKGGRKPGGRLASRCELFCECDLLVAAGRSLDVVAEAQLLEPHARIRGDLERLSAASALCEVARVTSYEDAPDPFPFPLLVRALTAVEEAADRPHLDLVCAGYAMKAVAHQGLRPQLAACVACGSADPRWFSVAAGGVLCGECVGKVEGAEHVTSEQLAWLEALIGLTFDELLTADIDPDTASWLVHAAHAWCAAHLDCRLRSWEFMRGL
jgi:DNA repair protein RecO (recombination protein O)